MNDQYTSAKNTRASSNNPAWLRNFEGFKELSEEELLSYVEFIDFFCTSVYEIMCIKQMEDYEQDSS